MAGRDHQIRVLTAMVMRKKGMGREEAMLWVMKFGPAARPALFRVLYRVCAADRKARKAA